MWKIRQQIWCFSSTVVIAILGLTLTFRTLDHPLQVGSNTLFDIVRYEQSGRKSAKKGQVYHAEEAVKYNSLSWRDLVKEELKQVEIYPMNISAQTPFSLDKAPLPYLKNYATPCWYEERPTPPLYKHNCLLTKGQHFTRLSKIALQYYRKSFRHLEDYMDEGGKQRWKWRLRCLPSVLLIGVDKCGTSDLYENLKQHPLIRASIRKEVRYWSNFRETCDAPLSDYSDTFDRAAEESRTLFVASVRENNSSRPYHPILMLDGTPSTYKQLHCPNVSYRNCGSQAVSIAGVVRRLLPEVKVIAMVRHPTERTHSSYFFSSMKVDNRTVDSDDFAEETEEVLKKFEECKDLYPTFQCALGNHMDITAQQKTVFLGSLYSIYLKQWKGEFRENFKLVKLEDYSTDPEATMGQIFDFLGLHHLKFHSSRSKGITNKAKHKPPMHDTTRALLNKFFKPYNVQLMREFGKHFLYE